MTDVVDWDEDDDDEEHVVLTIEDLDYYQLLEISRDSTTRQIKLAYRKKAAQYHPDRVAEKDDFSQEYALKMMKKLNLAKDVLMDAERRAEYDRWLESNDLDALSANEDYVICMQLIKMINLEMNTAQANGFHVDEAKRMLVRGVNLVDKKEFSTALDTLNAALDLLKDLNLKSGVDQFREHYDSLHPEQKQMYDQFYYEQMVMEAAGDLQHDQKDVWTDAYQDVQGPNGQFQVVSDKAPAAPTSGRKRTKVQDCPECGNGVYPEQMYCYYCGHKMS